MKLLIAEDDPFFCRLLQEVLAPHYELVVTRDGNEAWAALQRTRPPRLAVLDWVMPGLTGPQLCRKIRETAALSSMYLILFTARNSTADMIAGLRSGADDYVTKPFNPEELRTRVKAGQRIVTLQLDLASHAAKLERALAHARKLKSLLPICPCCRRLRVDDSYWRCLDLYIARHRATVSGPSSCPCCSEQVVGPEFQLTSGPAEGFL